jgi:hypothetical protein
VVFLLLFHHLPKGSLICMLYLLVGCCFAQFSFLYGVFPNWAYVMLSLFQNIYLFIYLFIAVYSLYSRGFVMTILIRLILYISFVVPIICPLPHLKKLQEIFLFYFLQLYEIHQPYTLILISIVHPPPFHLYPPHCTYFTVMFFIINIWVDVQRGFSMYPCCGYT